MCVQLSKKKKVSILYASLDQVWPFIQKKKKEKKSLAFYTLIPYIMPNILHQKKHTTTQKQTHTPNKIESRKWKPFTSSFSALRSSCSYSEPCSKNPTPKTSHLVQPASLFLAISTNLEPIPMSPSTTWPNNLALS